MEDKPLMVRTLKASLFLAPVIVYLFLTFGHKSWAWGFLLGAGLSLFSFLTLKVVVPMLFQPGAPTYVKGILGLTLWMKMPIICVVLYVGTNVPAICPGAMVPGIAFMPGVIVLRAIVDMISESVSHRRSAAKMNSVSEDLSAHAQRTARSAHNSEPLREGV